MKLPASLKKLIPFAIIAAVLLFIAAVIFLFRIVVSAIVIGGALWLVFRWVMSSPE